MKQYIALTMATLGCLNVVQPGPACTMALAVSKSRTTVIEAIADVIEPEPSIAVGDIIFDPTLDLNINMDAFQILGDDAEIELGTKNLDNADNTTPGSHGQQSLHFSTSNVILFSMFGSLIGIGTLLVCGIKIKQRKYVGIESESRIQSPTSRRAYRRATWSTNWVSGKSGL
eukprot:CFRG0596T1